MLPPFSLSTLQLDCALALLLIGLLIGRLINLLTYRLPQLMHCDWQLQAREILGLSTDAAAHPAAPYPLRDCAHCGRRQPLQHLLPLAGLLWPAACPACGHRPGGRNGLVEIGFALLAAGLGGWLGWQLLTVWLLLLAAGLLTLSLIDADHHLLPDALVLPLLWLGLLLNQGSLLSSPSAAFWGAVSGYLILWSLYWLFRLVTGREGMGYGDFKLLAMLGAWGGWQILPLTLLLASFTGALVGLFLLRRRGSPAGTLLPFGPYLALAGWIALLLGERGHLLLPG
ncbi:A24 family peptidase [Pseudomonas sp. NW5]|uniref:prepilin peptidase n=1 Tax=Pseudomonas sp. NW5 TaxID=2934934 RepID=UPI002020668B|nr:A24 family peptidase [Pseudomonas sp. NW5]MCL7461238.1 A24 family peptidase [Pseudomonas sp. NW5]